jgi:hypothetical protein
LAFVITVDFWALPCTVVRCILALFEDGFKIIFLCQPERYENNKNYFKET